MMAGDLTELEQLLLVAAAIHGLGPATNLAGANTARIVNQVLRWRGMSPKEVAAGWRLDECGPQHQMVYSALVHMTRQVHRDGGFRAATRPGPAKFEGGGNWGIPGDPEHPPCWPQYNSCRLTAEGERIAGELLRQHPEYNTRID